MIAVEGFESRVRGSLIEHVAVATVMRVRKESHPQDFLERLGAFGCDHDAVAMGALRGFPVAFGHPVQKPVPEVGGEYRRVVLVAVGYRALTLREHFEQNGAA